MFKNRSAQIKFVKTPKEPTQSSTVTSHIKITRKDVQMTLVTLLGAAIALKVTDAACDIAKTNYTK